MRLKRFLIVCLIGLVPVLAQGEVIHLKDGSSINGRLKKLVGDTLYVETSFGATIAIPRHQLARIDFGEVAAIIPSPAVAVTPSPAAVGTVTVTFEKFDVSSRVKIHRGKNEHEILRANSIELVFYVGSDVAYARIDSLTDKKVREGPDTIHKNEMRPVDFQVAVPVGSHQCRLFIRNSFSDGYEPSFVGDPLEKKLLIEQVNVLPSQTTELRIGMKRKMKVGSPQLYVFR